MEEIGKNIYLEESYAGVVLGAIKLDHGVLFVDSPMRYSAQQSWRAKVAQLGEGIDRITLMLDTHIDRTIGLESFGGTILGHRNAVEILANRPAALRAHDIEAGAEVELLDPPAIIRVALPDMTFSNKVTFYSDKTPITISHRPGAHLAGCWVRSDAEQIIFVGDSVLAHQPPFLAWCDLGIWLDELAELQSAPLKDYMIVSSRNGVVRKKAIEGLSDFLSHINEILFDLASQDDREGAIADLLPGLLRKISIDRKYINLYRKRLAYGLAAVLRRYDSDNNKEE